MLLTKQNVLTGTLLLEIAARGLTEQSVGSAVSTSRWEVISPMQWMGWLFQMSVEERI